MDIGKEPLHLLKFGPGEEFIIKESTSGHKDNYLNARVSRVLTEKSTYTYKSESNIATSFLVFYIAKVSDHGAYYAIYIQRISNNGINPVQAI